MPARFSLRLPLLLLLPLLLVGPSLLPGKRFLPLLPVALEPLASEDPEGARAAREGANFAASDRLFPILTDELEVREQLLGGTLPTWTTELGAGLPLAAGSMAAPWNPLRWPFLLLDPAIAGGWHALLSLVLAGLGMLLFLERRGLGSAAALFGALAFQAGGFGVANLHYGMKVDAALWLPWCCWAVDGVFAGKRFAPLSLFFALGASALAGFPPVFVFVLLFTLAWFAARAVAAREEKGVPEEQATWGERVRRAALFLVLGVLAGGVHLLPMLEVSGESTRRPHEARAVVAEALPPAAVATLIHPTLFGTVQEERPASRDPAVWWLTSAGDRHRALAANRLEWSLFGGVAVAALALAAIFAAPRRARFPALALGVVAYFLLGAPGASLLYALPGLNLGSPARAGALWWFLLPWLAAIGLDALLGERRNAARRAGGAALGLVFGLGLWWWMAIDPGTWAEELEETLTRRHGVDASVVHGFFSRADATAVAERVLAGVRRMMLLSGLAGVLLLAAGRLGARAIGAGWMALILVEGLLAGLPHVAPRTLEGAALFPDSPAIEAIREATGDGRVLRIDRSESGIDEVLRLARPNLLSAYGIADLTPYVAFPPESLVLLFDRVDGASRYRTGTSRLSDPALLDHHDLDRLRVTCILSTERIDHPRLDERYAREGFFVYARSGVWPVARIVPRLVLRGSQEHDRVSFGAVDPAEYALCEDAEVAGEYGGEAFAAGEVLVARPSPDRVDLLVQGGSAGWVVLNELWAPGWKATVNGRDALVRQVDHAFRGVQITGNRAVVRMKYEPLSLRLGAGATILATILALVLTWRTRASRDARWSGILAAHASAEPGKR